MVTVCESCSTVVARTDREFAALGKTADLTQTQSPLELWLQGSHHGVGFQITGRAQLRHNAGGIWDEWYLAFDDGRWGWLAEAQGRFYLTFEQPNTGSVDPQNLTTPGLAIQVGNPLQRMIVAETGQAELLAGRGEIPYLLEIGSRYWYADLSGEGRRFGTLDLSNNPPTLFLGHEVTLAALGLAHAAPANHALDEHAPGLAPTESLTCQNCGGSLELRAPDLTERVACPYCGALHDCNQGLLRFLSVLERPAIRPVIPLSSQGRFEGQTLTVIGFMRRRASSGGESFYWDEYLLYHPRVGFRWLVESNAGFTYLTPVNIADVKAPAVRLHHAKGEVARYGGKRYTFFQSGSVEVSYVAGEFYWKVEAGQRAFTVDYIRPPELLSAETTETEINWSLGSYMSRDELAAAFGGLELPKPLTTLPAPNRPYPHTGVYTAWAGLMLLAVVALLWASSVHPNRLVFGHTMRLTADELPTPEGVVYFSEPFQLQANQNLAITGYSPEMLNSWMYIQADLYNQDTGLVLPFDMGIEYYYGVESGESWSEGSLQTTRHLSAVPEGSYVLRLAVQRSSSDKPATLHVSIHQGVLRLRYWLLAVLGLSIIPIGIFLHRRSFEAKRWSQSDFSD